MLCPSYQEEHKEVRPGETELDFALRLSAGEEGDEWRLALAESARFAYLATPEADDAALARALAASLDETNTLPRDFDLDAAIAASLAEADRRAALQAARSLDAADRAEEEERTAALLAALSLDAADRAEEEALTAAVLAGIIQTVAPAAAQPDGTVVVDGQRLAPRECGASYGGHTGLCGYLSLTAGDGAAAVALKAALAAQLAARGRPDFSGAATMIDTEALWAYVRHARAPLYVYNAPLGRALRFGIAGERGPAAFLYFDGGHYRRLVPA